MKVKKNEVLALLLVNFYDCKYIVIIFRKISGPMQNMTGKARLRNNCRSGKATNKYYYFWVCVCVCV